MEDLGVTASSCVVNNCTVDVLLGGVVRSAGPWGEVTSEVTGKHSMTRSTSPLCSPSILTLVDEFESSRVQGNTINVWLKFGVFGF